MKNKEMTKTKRPAQAEKQPEPTHEMPTPRQFTGSWTVALG
jgi:hypothetical protein